MIAVIPSPIGALLIEAVDGAITKLESTTNAYIAPGNELLSEAAKQIDAYFNGTLRVFTLPVNTHGTPFQESVWDCMRKIPYGDTLSYQACAQAINNEKAVRAVGGACNKNPVLLINPCHRIVGKHGLGGFALDLTVKQFLLDLERDNA